MICYWIYIAIFNIQTHTHPHEHKFVCKCVCRFICIWFICTYSQMHTSIFENTYILRVSHSLVRQPRLEFSKISSIFDRTPKGHQFQLLSNLWKFKRRVTNTNYFDKYLSFVYTHICMSMCMWVEINCNCILLEHKTTFVFVTYHTPKQHILTIQFLQFKKEFMAFNGIHE